MTRKTLLWIAVTIVVCSGTRTAPPIHAQTQPEMNRDADRQLLAAEAEMEEVLSSLRRKALGHSDALANLSRAQAAWVAYRDAHIDSLWPSAPEVYGTVQPLCVLSERTKLMVQRVAELRPMLMAEEGDVCSGAWPD